MTELRLTAEPKVGGFQIAVLVLTVFNLMALVADTVLVLPKEVSRLIQTADTGVCVILLVDFFHRLIKAEEKLRFLKWGWIDLVASIPNLDVLRWGRLVRVLRVIRLLRGVRTLQRVLSLLFRNKVEGGMVSVGLTVFLMVVFSSLAILICEQVPEANIKTAEDAVWWSVSTMTTVGYGDKYPVTTEGRLIGMALMVMGVGLFGGLSGLAASFILGAKSKTSEETLAILHRLESIEKKLDELHPERAGKE